MFTRRSEPFHVPATNSTSRYQQQKQRSSSEDATCHGKKRDDDSDEGPNGDQLGRDDKSDGSTPTRGSQSSSFSQKSS